MYGLPFSEIWALDFEFISEPGAQPVPVCLVAHELCTGGAIRLWQDELTARPPFRIADDVLFLAYFSSAEWGCFAALGWPMPTRVIDLYVEFRRLTNGTALPAGRGLLGALAHHGIRSITAAEKDRSRALVMTGGPWSVDERAEVLDYCESDVTVLAPLFERMHLGIRATQHGLGQALLRGRYMVAVARMEFAGVPLDVAALTQLRSSWESIKRTAIDGIDKDFGVYEDGHFRAGLFADYLAHTGIGWPLTSTGRLALDSDTFRDMARSFPQLEPLRQLRATLSELRLEDLAVGPDGRNRVLLSPFGAKTGRNTPSNSRSIFGPAVWLRGLIRPTPGRGLAYLDWSSQEVVIAAALSGDTALMAAVESGDPYLAFAKLAGLAPPNATKQTHPDARALCKTCVLGTNYGMQARALAYRTGLSMLEAADLLRSQARVFPAFTEWADNVVDVGVLTGELHTMFGWPVHVSDDVRPTALRNFPVQATGAEMMRLAACLLTETGMDVNMPVHDAFLIEADLADLADTADTAKATMSRAAQIVLDGPQIDVDALTVRYPGRYMDPRGRAMWDRITELAGVDT